MQKITQENRNELFLFVFAVFVIAACGFLYELLISTVSSYFLGNSIFHFSVTMGFFMFSMGLGSYFSKFIEEKLLHYFIVIEILIGVVGGISTLLLYLSFSVTEYYYLLAFILIIAIGGLVGLEIPLVARIIKKYCTLKDVLANIFTFDYLGALIASLIFPMILLPYFGIMRTSFIVGILNLLVAFLVVFWFRKKLKKVKLYFGSILFFIFLLILGILYSFKIVGSLEQFIYQDDIIFTKQTPYQKIVVTAFKNDIRLFINGNIQFSSIDEYRYHESIVHVPLSIAQSRKNILVLGGGDGMVAREILKYDDVESIKIVDIDPEMTKLGQDNEIFKRLNDDSLNDDKVKIINEDAYNFIQNSNEFFDVVIIDLPDPNDLSSGKLYSREFYELLKKRLSYGGVVVTQSTSPFFAREPFWIINHTLQSVFEDVIPYTAYIPSFGQWGFNMVINNSEDFDELNDIESSIDLEVETEFLNDKNVLKLFIFDKDISEVDTEVNTLDNQILIQSYEKSWKYFNQ